MKRYLFLLMAFSAGAFLLLSTINYFIDPYGIYQLEHDYFPRKVAAADKGRTVKPYQALNVKPHTVLVGNSRVEIGMPVVHAFYQNKPVYNMGLPGAGLSMQYAYARHVINNSNSVKQVVIALDFLDFTSRPDNIITSTDNSNWLWRLQGFDSKHLSDKRRYVAEQISLLFSLSALTDSVKTVVAQNHNLNALNLHGFNDGKLYHFHVANEGFGALYQQKLQELDQRLSSQPLIFSHQSYHLHELDSFITELKQQNIAVYLLINPYQQPYLSKLTQYQLDDHLQNWKTQLAKLAMNHGLSLFDFAITSSLVTQIVDPASKTAADSRYFWEPAHYRPAFGELILESLLKADCEQLCLIKKTRCNSNDNRKQRD